MVKEAENGVPKRQSCVRVYHPRPEDPIEGSSHRSQCLGQETKRCSIHSGLFPGIGQEEGMKLLENIHGHCYIVTIRCLAVGIDDV